MTNDKTCQSAASVGCSGCPSAAVGGCCGASGGFGALDLPEPTALDVSEGEKPDLIEFLLSLPDVDE